MIKFETRKTWEKFVTDLQEDCKRNKLLCAVMRNKTKSKTEPSSIRDKNRKLVWIQAAYLRTWIEHFVELLNGQTDSEDITENNHITQNSNVPDKAEVNMLHL
jgi:hypothetical protein